MGPARPRTAASAGGQSETEVCAGLGSAWPCLVTRAVAGRGGRASSCG